MTRDESVALALADAMLAGAWSRSHLSLRVRRTLGLSRAPRWITDLTVETLAAYRTPPRDRPRELAAFLRSTRAWIGSAGERRRVRVVLRRPSRREMAPGRWPVAELPDHGALARFLGVDQGELAWFADLRNWERTCAPRLRHYTWRALPKRGGGERLVAAPKSRLKVLQRRLLADVLAPIPVHDAAHGGVPGRSVRTAVAPHAGATTVIRLDLVAFFASIPAARVYGVLRSAGYPEAVARTLTGLMTTVAPREVSRELRTPHLPQGAPTSPRLADLVAFSLDRRLTGLAASFGASYTRYVDDLTISGGPSLRSARSRVVELVDAIVRDEGFRLNERKTVVLGDAGRQQVLGVVVNAHPAVPRPERDALRALLHNCVVHGWASQAGDRSREEFRAHLLGRIAWVGGIRPAHGRRLDAVAARIDWSP
jgi:RNA-directed DNA polymerase